MDAIISMKKVKDTLVNNISSLYTTAKAEIERKDRLIADLRIELEDIKFRRFTKANQYSSNVNNQTDSKKELEEVKLVEGIKRENVVHDDSKNKSPNCDNGYDYRDNSSPISDNHMNRNYNNCNDNRKNYHEKSYSQNDSKRELEDCELAEGVKRKENVDKHDSQQKRRKCDNGYEYRDNHRQINDYHKSRNYNSYNDRRRNYLEKSEFRENYKSGGNFRRHSDARDRDRRDRRGYN